MKKYFLFMLLTIMISEVSNSQGNSKIKLELSAVPYQFNVDNSSILTPSFNLSGIYLLKPKVNISLSFDEIYLLNKTYKTYDNLSSFGIGIGYFIYEGKAGTFWGNSKFEIKGKTGYGFSNYFDDTDFLYYDISLRGYIGNRSFMGFGINHKLSDNMNDLFGFYAAYGVVF